MLISIIIMMACFVTVTFELGYVLYVFHTCRSIKCIVTASKKVCAREDGFLIKEYWKTEVEFTLNGDVRHTALETSTYCQKGQVLGCYYHPKKDLVFRKRDIKRVLRSYSLPALTIGLLFMMLYSLFKLTSLGNIIIGHAFEAVGILLIVVFASFGVGFIVYAVSAFRHTRESRVTQIDAKITDIVRKTKRHRETKRYLYYPIYSYKLGGFEHSVRSKLGRETPPKKDSTERVLADTKKGGLVEYKDMSSSFVMGLCFLVIAWLLLYTIAFMK